MKNLPVLVLITFFVVPVYGDILTVPSDLYPTIQAAIDSAVNSDTILVEQGTYYERINFDGKNITLASQYLFNSDTSIISKTIIDGQRDGSVVTFETGEDTSALLIGFTIENGFAFPGDGAGIRCINGSSPKLRNLVIRNNTSGVGGGIFAYNNSHLILEQVHVRNNNAIYSGAGISCDRHSSVRFRSGTVFGNSTNDDGGGIYLSDSSYMYMENVLIAQNYSEFTGGAIFASTSRMDLVSTVFTANFSFQGGALFFENCYETIFDGCRLEKNIAWEQGGAMYAYESELSFRNTRILHNQAYYSGGGIYTAFSTLSFDDQKKSNIYFNFAGLFGNDFYSDSDDPVTVSVDTFTVFPVTEYQAYPLEAFQIDAQTGKVSKAGNELYVSPEGSDDNDGLTPENPLGTIACALTKIEADSNNQAMIYLATGTYGPFYNNDFFPLNLRSYTCISGENSLNVVLDGSDISPILAAADDRQVILEKMTIRNAFGYNGSAVYMNNSLAGFYQTVFQDNTADFGAAFYLENRAVADILNGTLAGNEAYYGGVVYLRNASASVANSIFWGNLSDALVFDPSSDPNAGVVAFSDLQGGEDGLTSINNGALYWLVGNIDQSPLFEDSTANDFRLQALSPCIDAGRQDTILYYNDTQDSLIIPALVFNDNAPDMGAWESGQPNIISRTQQLPERYVLSQNFPNPFNPQTTIRYALPRVSDIEIRVYNTLGQLVQVHQQKELTPGVHEFIFNGNLYSSGIYYYVLMADDFTASKKMLLLK